MHCVFRSRGDKDCWSTRTATWGQQISEQWESRCIERKDRSDESSTEREHNVKSWSCKGKWDSWAYRKSLGKGFFSQKRRWREGWEKEGEGYLWGAHSDIVWAVADQSQRWIERRRAKFAKPFTLGAEKRWRGVEEKQSRGQRLVARANPGDSRVACQWKCIMGIILWLCVLAWKVRDHL